MRILFAPIALFYGLLLKFRHWLYNNGLLSSYQAPVFTLCVGNLELGGTGKTPHAAYLLEHFLEKGEKPVFLSRGYQRQTTGYQVVQVNSSSLKVGDEPLWIKINFPQIPVVVCENRKEGILALLKQFPETTLVILDDAFQHRAIHPTFSLLLTPSKKPFWNNQLLPWGSLRDVHSAAQRADFILQTKAINELVPAHYQGIPLLDSTMEYGLPYVALSKEENKVASTIPWMAFCGIAQPQTFFDACQKLTDLKIETLAFPDHYIFKENDLRQLQEKAKQKNALLITTEKDWMRIKNLQSVDFQPIYVLPMKVRIKRESEFWNLLDHRLQSFKQSKLS
jgi:tetraacyldisaccharide 4'-kinase